MRTGNRFKAGIAAAIGAGRLVVTPTVSNVGEPGELEHLPDGRCRADVRSYSCSRRQTAPAADRPSHLRRDGSSDDGVVDVSCTSRPLLHIVACAE